MSRHSEEKLGHEHPVCEPTPAGGEEILRGFSGIAPQADLAVVKLKEAKHYLRQFYLIRDQQGERQVPVFQENDIMLALKYLSDLADRERRPMIVCLALGSNTGNHGILPYLSDYIDFLSDSNFFVVSGVGNEANKRHHFEGQVQNNEQLDMEIRVSQNRTGFWLEIWGDAPDLFSIGITSPGGDQIERILNRLGETQRFEFVFEKTTVIVNYLLYGAQVGNPLIVVRMQTPSDGVWKIQVTGERLVYGVVNAYLPLTEFIDGETYFLNSSPDRTIVNPAAAQRGFAFGAYDPRNNSIYYASGRGFPINNLIKPDLAAQGVQVLGLGPNERLTAYSGTGVAAAVAAGA